MRNANARLGHRRPVYDAPHEVYEETPPPHTPADLGTIAARIDIAEAGERQETPDAFHDPVPTLTAIVRAPPGTDLQRGDLLDTAHGRLEVRVVTTGPLSVRAEARSPVP